MYASMFVFDLIDEILNLNLTSNEYTEIEGVQCGRNIFYYCIRRNHKYLNPNCAFALKYVLLKKIKHDYSLKNKIYYYFKNIDNDLKDYIEKNPKNLEQIIDISISKFTNPESQQHKTKNIYDIKVKEISELYIKISLYLNKDFDTALILLKQINTKILDYVSDEEKIKFVNRSIDKMLIKISAYNILPSDILSYMIYLNTLENSNNIHSSKEFVKMIFLNIKYIVKWFLKNFIKEPEYFATIYCKVYTNFKQDEFEDIKIYSIDELEKKSWTLRKFSEQMLKVFYETIGENFENVTGIEELMEIINLQRDTHKIMLNTENNAVGCWSFAPIKDELFEKDKNGKLLISELTPLTIPTMFPGKTYNIHFGAICLLDSYRKTQVFSKLLFSIMNEIEKLAINRIFVNEIVTKACSNSGINLAESIGLKYCCDHISGDGKIYSGNINTLLESLYLKDFTILKSLYKNL